MTQEEQDELNLSALIAFAVQSWLKNLDHDPLLMSIPNAFGTALLACLRTLGVDDKAVPTFFRQAADDFDKQLDISTRPS